MFPHPDRVDQVWEEVRPDLHHMLDQRLEGVRPLRSELKEVLV